MIVHELEMDPEVLTSPDYWGGSLNTSPYSQFYPRSFQGSFEKKRISRDMNLAAHIRGLAESSMPGDAGEEFFEGDELPRPLPNNGSVLRAVIDAYLVMGRDSIILRSFKTPDIKNQDIDLFNYHARVNANPSALPDAPAMYFVAGPKKKSVMLFRRSAYYMLASPKYDAMAGLDGSWIAHEKIGMERFPVTTVGQHFDFSASIGGKVVAAAMVHPSGPGVKNIPEVK